MLWELEWGPRIKALRAEQAAAGRPNPRLASRPTLRDDVWDVWNAYIDLSDQRGFNPAGMQPTPVSEILSYVNGFLYLPRGYRAARMLRLIKSMDQAHLSWAAKKLQSEQPNKPKK